MPAQRKQPAFASNDWMLEQQMRAEMEAEAWRRLREQAAAPPALSQPVTAEPIPAPFNPHQAGSAALKALVRFALAAAGAYLAYLAGIDSRLGEFEIWLAIGATFVCVLAVSMLGPARGLVHALAETLRWALIAGLVVGGFWLASRLGGAGP